MVEMHVSCFVERIVSPVEMGQIDAAAALSGIDSFGLMRNAGLAVAAAALRLFPGALRFVVLCGPGNNGGDGYIAATGLHDSGAAIVVHALGDPERLSGDAARACAACPIVARPLADCSLQPGDVIVDALFGAGLARPVGDTVAGVMEAASTLKLSVLAVDLPSGIDGRTGAVLGASFQASHTVTFVARKPGHILLPGRSLCGTVECVDIGIPERVVHAHAGTIRINAPAIWASRFRQLRAEDHKYRRGHLVVFSGGPWSSGAARLSAQAGLAAGAGLVTIAAGATAMAVHAANLTAIMLHKLDRNDDLHHWLSDMRLSTFVLGPGFGEPERARAYVKLIAGRQVVLDADGITAFRDEPDLLFSLFSAGPVRLVATPHEGEFARLFPDLARDATLSKIERAIAAARRMNGIVVYKGADTVIAGPDGRAAVNENAPPWLATAGSGDVLAGIIGAHLAQGMPAYEAACAGVWRHGEAGVGAGACLTAETLIVHIGPL